MDLLVNPVAYLRFSVIKTDDPLPSSMMPALHEPWHRRWWNRILDIVYAPSCELCQEPLREGRYLCDGCRDALPRIAAPFCTSCGEMFDGNITSNFLCPNCRDLSYDFRFARPVLQSSEPARGLIHGLKYQRNLYLARDLARIASEAFSDERLKRALEERWALVPVPLHWKREQSRHYNQSEEIARHLGKMLGLPLVKALKRVRATPTQTHLSRRQRLQNLRGAIELTRAGRRLDRETTAGIIIIDDVFTTGATVQECARMLKKNQHENIVVVTVMRG
jgi:competence protein ComFC